MAARPEGSDGIASSAGRDSELWGRQQCLALSLALSWSNGASGDPMSEG